MTGIVQRLGNDVISVFSGQRYAEQDAQTVTLRADQLDDYQSLFARLAAQERLPGLIVSFWAITDEATPVRNDAAATSLHCLAQTLGSSQRETIAQLVVVSDRLQIVTGEEASAPASARSRHWSTSPTT